MQKEQTTLADYRNKLIVNPGNKLRLKDVDPAFKGHHETKEAAAPELERYRQKLSQMQALLYAEKKHSILIVLQAMDAGGKDGTIKHVFAALNPQGASVAVFKQPTPIELDHDFLWRVHPHAPPKGWVAIFNRSHYEDVLVTRVHKLVDKPTCTARYELIRAFELGLKESGTAILKFFLHISKEEQLARFGKRLDDPSRNWKISESDYTERALWDDYMRAVEDALSATSTRDAPWYVIPANHKWFRNLAVAQIVADTMEELGMSFPKPSVDLAEIRRKYHAAVREENKVEGGKAGENGLERPALFWSPDRQGDHGFTGSIRRVAGNAQRATICLEFRNQATAEAAQRPSDKSAAVMSSLRGGERRS